MNKSFCGELLKYYPQVSEFEELHSSSITNCVFNSFLCYTAILLNIISIRAIRRTSSLPKTLKLLLLSLTVSDVGVGLLAQPFYISLLVHWLWQKNPGCSAFKAFGNIVNLFSVASFCGVVAVSVDRFLAIHLHLRYQELVTYKRVVAVVISIWLLSLFLAAMALWVPREILSLVVCITLALGLGVTTLVYSRIYLAVRRHKNQIQALQVQQVSQFDQMANFASLVKSVVGVFYIYLVFLICYMPHFVALVAFEINGSSIALKKFSLFSVTLVFLNSSLNPVIYYWKMRHIRQAIMDILQTMSCLGNWIPHHTNRKTAWPLWYDLSHSVLFLPINVSCIWQEPVYRTSIVCTRAAWGQPRAYSDILISSVIKTEIRREHARPCPNWSGHMFLQWALLALLRYKTA